MLNQTLLGFIAKIPAEDAISSDLESIPYSRAYYYLNDIDIAECYKTIVYQS
ncbi:MAG: hypothetical protein LBE09_00760 [Christensenellaceae bacterium]|jgi:hypothetical protein|nr:hypothetical protein [Christensenellaceae bacterium]